jgi:hypothetical protein
VEHPNPQASAVGRHVAVRSTRSSAPAMPATGTSVSRLLWCQLLQPAEGFPRPR